jgi:hypothetical protein
MNNYSNNKSILALFIVVVAGLFFCSNNVYALSLTPVRIEITGNPGDNVSKEITLINENDGDETYYSSFANFEASGDTGNPSFCYTQGRHRYMDDSTSFSDSKR